MTGITLSAAVRQNLLTLQTTADMMSGVQNKLATGLDVNSALDNPNSYFTASGLNARANDLGSLLDDMGQSLQTITAADQGISTITDLVNSAEAKARQAQQTQSQAERATYAEQFNELLTQIEDIAKDASYKGKNLLGGAGNDLTTIFNEDNTSQQTITAVDYTDTALSTGLNLSDLDEAKGGAVSFQLSGGSASITTLDAAGDPMGSGGLLTAVTGSAYQAGDVISLQDTAGGAGAQIGGTSTLTIAADTTVGDLVDFINSAPGTQAEYDTETGTIDITSNTTIAVRNSDAGAGGSAAPADIAVATAADFTADTQKLTEAGSFGVGDTLELTDGNGYELGSFTVEEDSTVDDLVDFINDFQGVDASFDSSDGKITIESDVSLNLTSNNDENFNAVDFVADNASGTEGVQLTAEQDSGFATDDDIDRVLDRLNTALSTLRAQASEFGTNLSTVEHRQSFTTSLINTLQEGAGKLTLADTNLEGANLLALQTRQQLASTSLSFASQADQTVLSLF